MRYGGTHTAYGNATGTNYRRNWTGGGLVAALAVIPALLVLVTAPALVLTALLGAVLVKTGEQFVSVYRATTADRRVSATATADSHSA